MALAQDAEHEDTGSRKRIPRAKDTRLVIYGTQGRHGMDEAMWISRCVGELLRWLKVTQMPLRLMRAVLAQALEEVEDDLYRACPWWVQDPLSDDWDEEDECETV